MGYVIGGAFVVLIAALCIWSIHKDHKTGKCAGCGGGSCGSCGGSCSCSSGEAKNPAGPGVLGVSNREARLFKKQVLARMEAEQAEDAQNQPASET